MNYRHAFHAGNFADCMKHALLVALLRALLRKPAALFVLDTHAGAGRYDLDAEPARRTDEAARGILRLLDPKRAVPRHGPARIGLDDGADPLRDYIAQVRGLGRDPIGAQLTEKTPCHRRSSVMAGPSPAMTEETVTGTANYAPARLYPGSPGLIRSLLRPDDRLACCEAHPEECSALRALFRRDAQVVVHQRDGWEALKALLPPSQKRGLVLIDPPYEAPDEFSRLAEGLSLAHARFPTGVLAAWYPLKHRAPVRALFDSLALRDVITCELSLREPLDPARLNGCGLLVVNPPYQFEQTAQSILDALLERLGDREPGEAALVTRLADE